VAGADTVQRFAAGGVKVGAADLLANDTDTNSDSLTIAEVSPSSGAGGTVSLNGGWVYYTPPPGFTNADTFTYTVSDGHCGTDVGTVSVEVKPDDPRPSSFTIQNLGDGSFRLSFSGMPGYVYWIQYTEDLSNPNWQMLSTPTADVFGACEYTDWPPTNTPARFYRLLWP
jgi:hypothetical protein